ncbi:glycosyltransferase family 4 protein [Desulfurococcus mucosus]|nr:glycosyltransferase family 4 protein [Desulfurococcus mucosus]
MIDGKLAEEDGQGWHFRSALALRRLGGFAVEAVRPSGESQGLVKVVDEIPLVLTPTLRLSPSHMLWKWDEVSPELARYVEHRVSRDGYIPYIHEYRALNSELVVRRLTDHPVILQHHGSSPPSLSRLMNPSPFSVAKELSKIKREGLLRKIHGVFFVVNIREKKYLEEVLGVEARVLFRTMAVDFEKLRPPAWEEVQRFREALGIPLDAVVLVSYVGIFREEASFLKGLHYIPVIWKMLRKEYGGRIVIVLTGVSGRWRDMLREMGIRVYGFLPHQEFLRFLSTSDIYFFPATGGYYGGPGVAVMEAMALGKPVVSPTFLEMPREAIPRTGAVVTPFVGNAKDLNVFIKRLKYVVDNVEVFRARTSMIREEAHRVFSWESFVRDFTDAARGL